MNRSAVRFWCWEILDFLSCEYAIDDWSNVNVELCVCFILRNFKTPSIDAILACAKRLLIRRLSNTETVVKILTDLEAGIRFGAFPQLYQC